jgi:hypothetical protein
MRRAIEALFNIVIVLIVAFVGTAIGYFAAGNVPKRDAVLDVARVIGGTQTEVQGVRQTIIVPNGDKNGRVENEKPGAEEQRRIEERAEAARHKEKIQARYNSCMQQASLTFNRSWDERCTLGQDCKLPVKLAESLGAQLQASRNKCAQEFQAALE